MFCTRCGKQIDDNAGFCIYCGTPLHADAGSHEQTPDEPLPAQPPSAEPAAYAPPARPDKKKPNKLLWIGVPVLAACAVFLVLLFTGVFRFGAVPAVTIESDGSGNGLTLSEPVTVAQTAIPAGGGTVTVNRGSSAINGLTIEVPPGSYASEINFTVAEAAVRASGFPEDLMIVSPVFSVDNGGAYASEMMIVKVPCSIPDGYIPLGFYYDEATKSLESIPVLDAIDGYVTLGLRHFSDGFVGAVSEEDAAAVTKDDTGFRPGVDDFHMENNGSYIAPGGHCAGQSLAIMWYYANKKKKGGPNLWNLYDNYGKDTGVTFKTPDFQYDDVMAQRLASVAQSEATWSSETRRRFMEASKLSDKATFYGLALAIKLQKFPQYVAIQRLDAKGEVEGGHALIAYRVEGNRIYVADPNYPGKTDRYIELVDGKFKPYSSAATAEDAAAGKGVDYTRINFVGLTGMYDYDKLGQLWNELENRTVGDAYFPQIDTQLIATIETDTGKQDVEVTNGYEAPGAELKIKGVSSSDSINYGLSVTDGKGKVKKLSPDTDKGFTVPLTPGVNYIGISIFRKAGGHQTWYGFKWVRVLLSFSYAGEWKGTMHYDRIVLPTPDPTASSAAYDAYKSLEGRDVPVFLRITPTAAENTFNLTIAESESELASASVTMEITVSKDTAKGSQVIEGRSTTTITLEPDGASFARIKGSMSVTTAANPNHGMFITLKLERAGS